MPNATHSKIVEAHILFSKDGMFKGIYTYIFTRIYIYIDMPQVWFLSFHFAYYSV